MERSLRLLSKITRDGQLEVSLVKVDAPRPGPGEVLVRMEAAPINPSDMGPLLGPADIGAARVRSVEGRLVLTAPVPPARLSSVALRLDKELPVGNEGAGTVVAAGSDAEAQALIGKTVGVLCGTSYAQYCCVPVASCLVLNEGTTAVEAADCFVNPLTALGMVETMRLEDHKALVHTAAASNLGQMLARLCLAENVPLVNIVRKQEQADLLRGMGAKYVCVSSSETFLEDLTDAIADAGATLAFDAIGGGRLVNDILFAMERAAGRTLTRHSTYGSSTRKQAYIYGGLDQSPTVLDRTYGMAWSIGAWLLPQFLQQIGYDQTTELRRRVADEIKTTFASNFTRVLSLEEAITPEIIQLYVAKKTGEKYLINPQKGLQG